MKRKLCQFCYGGQSTAFFAQQQHAIAEHNSEMLINLTRLCTVAMALMALVSLPAAHLAQLRGVYMVYTVLFAFFTVWCRWQRKKQRQLGYTAGYVFMLFLFSFGILIGTRFAPNQAATMFFVFMLTAPLLFILPLQKIYAFVLPAFGVFAVCALLYKNPAIAVFDLTNGVVCLVVGVWLCAMVLNSRISVLAVEEQLRRMCDKDELTGLPNRRSFNRYMEAVYPLKAQLALVVADIDDFKHYNDSYGHLEGDEALREVARLLESYAQENNLFVARYGGEEFVMADSQHSTADFEWMIQRLLENVKEAKAGEGNLLKSTISLSAGMATKQEQEHWEQLVARADAALYQAKRQRKNQLVRDDALAAAENA